jgi:hypothetical protein
MFSQKSSAVQYIWNYGAAPLAAYLQSVPNNTILVGITGDEPTLNLQPAWSALADIGAPVSDVAYRGSFVFVAQKGYPNKTILRKSNSITIPVNVAVILEGENPEIHHFNLEITILN